VDVALSVASLRAEPRAWSMPIWSSASQTKITGAWHPLIDVPVANDVDLCAGRGTIITGANMSGKSTYLRPAGIAAVLSRAINTCPAASWEGAPLRVRSLIGRSDDLSAGKSYYQVEADGVVALLADAQQHIPTLFLLDELLRGTNTIERLAAGEAVSRALLSGHDGCSPHAVIVATHDGELVTLLVDLSTPIHFRETIGPGGLSFDYKRHDGPATTRTAIALLEATGAPKQVVLAARARATQLDIAASTKPHSITGGGVPSMHPRIHEVLDYLDTRRAALTSIVATVPPGSRDRRSAPDRWSVAEVLEHLALVEGQVTGLLTKLIDSARASANGPDPETSAIVPTVDLSRLLNRSQQVTAGEASQPRAGLDATAAEAALTRQREALRALVVSADGLALAEVTSPNRLLGPLNAYQWVVFVAGHEARHTAQIEEIAAALEGPASHESA
jgi:hypothetical protein